jgi:hypothetical protein
VNSEFAALADQEGPVADIIFLATIVAFFSLCVGYVSLCGRIIGPDDALTLDDGENDAADEAHLERAA